MARPRKDAQADAAVDAAARTGAPVGEAAKGSGVSRATAFRAKARRRAAQGAPAGPAVAGTAQGGSPPLKPATGQPTASTGPSANASPLDRLRTYAAHDHEALAALEALTAPPEEGLGRDELLALREGLVLAAGLVRDAAKLRKDGGEEGGDGPLLRALQRLEGLGKTVATVKSRRKDVEGPDEVTRRLVGARDAAIARVRILTSDVATKFAREREDLRGWLATLGPMGVEVERRVGAMLGEAG